jgi:hypothetical protein
MLGVDPLHTLLPPRPLVTVLSWIRHTARAYAVAALYELIVQNGRVYVVSCDHRAFAFGVGG